MKTCSRGLLAVAGFSLALNLLMLAAPLYMMTVYDRVLRGRSTETLLMLTIAAAGALLAIAILEAVKQLVLTRVGTRLEVGLGERIWRASLMRPSEGGTHGLRDLVQVRQFISSPLASALLDAPVAPFYFALIYLIHPSLGWLLFAATILILGIAVTNQRVSSKALALTSTHTAAALQKAQEQARNAEVIRSMGMLPASVSFWGKSNAAALKAADQAGKLSAFFNSASKFLRLSLQIAIVGYGAYLVLADNSVSPGIIFAASMISARALAPIDQAVSGWQSVVAARGAWQRLRNLLRTAPKSRAAMALPAPEASVVVENLVAVPHPGARPVLKGLSFVIEPGEVLGVVGPSGSGKSTLARLLVGAIAPANGVIRIGGDDRENWGDEALGPYLGYVPQDVELFPATVAQNIARMDECPDPDKVVAAARLANCHHLIQALPQGYDTILGHQNFALSGGQRQRIALARAFYGSPKLVVLDEPNASLDSDGEQALIATLRQARDLGITCVVITQRASVMPALTKIMVLRDGRIEAFGTKDEVMPIAVRSPVEAPTPSSAKQTAADIQTSTFTARFG